MFGSIGQAKLYKWVCYFQKSYADLLTYVNLVFLLMGAFKILI
jgi:hypothetical protein